MNGYFKKILFFMAIISILPFFVFLGGNYAGNGLASLSGVVAAWVTINPLGINVSAPANVEINKVFNVKTKITNRGKEKIKNSEVEIHLPSGLTLLNENFVKEIKVIPSLKKKIVSWPVRAEEIGDYVITVSVSGELGDDLISAEDSVTVEVKESLPKRYSLSHWLRNIFDFFQYN